MVGAVLKTEGLKRHHGGIQALVDDNGDRQVRLPAPDRRHGERIMGRILLEGEEANVTSPPRKEGTDVNDIVAGITGMKTRNATVALM